MDNVDGTLREDWLPALEVARRRNVAGHAEPIDVVVHDRRAPFEARTCQISPSSEPWHAGGLCLKHAL